MTTQPHFDFSATKLTPKNEWRIASEICHQWLHKHMSVFGPDRINDFMHNQPVAAAKLIDGKCDTPTDESMTVALLGPAKFDMINQDGSVQSQQREERAREIFGDRAIDLIRSMAGVAPKDAQMKTDMNRLFLVEGLSTMNDQMIGRKRIDRHHQVRWNILTELEDGFKQIKGENPKLDALFVDCLKRSRDTLEGLDKAAAEKANDNAPATPKHKKPNTPKGKF